MMAKFYFGCTILKCIILEDNTGYIIYFTCCTDIWWIADWIIIIFLLMHQISLMVLACNTFQSWVTRQYPWQRIIVNHTHYTQMFNCLNGLWKSSFWLWGSPEDYSSPIYKKKRGQVSNCDVTLELWTQKAQLADGKSVQSAYQKLYIPSLYINGIWTFLICSIGLFV